MERPFEALISRLSALDLIQGLYQQALDELELRIGAPICVADCGKCCEHNTVMVWGIEVESIATHLLGLGQLLDVVMDRCEDWLMARNGRTYSPQALRGNIPKLLEEARAVYTSRCPLLEGTKCLIHMARPLACRAYGVTSYPVGCNRPLGLGETPDTRAVNTGMGPVITEAFNQVLRESAEDDFFTRVGFLPTLLMARLRADRYTSLVDSGRVNPIKLVKNYVHSPAILTQQQTVDFTLAGDKALQEIEKRGIPTGPVIVHVG